jgi:hypothetical protein
MSPFLSLLAATKRSLTRGRGNAFATEQVGKLLMSLVPLTDNRNDKNMLWAEVNIRKTESNVN